jgi:acetylornithine deacetylase/succinyl-diaminopimelate desuccinylase-like protein
MSTPNRWEQYLADREQQHLDELMEFLRIPSVSALPEHQGDVLRAAEWVAAQLQQAGVPEVRLLPTRRNPIVFGHWQVSEDQPTALIYGHYDVQPPDPLDLWQSPPFEPAIRDGRIYARGACDDKGNLLMPVKAIEALARTQEQPPINVKFFIEGEEEIGSPSLRPFVQAERDRLACDFVICADGDMFGPNDPSLTVATKGLVACQVNLRTADTDLHSGLYGASMPNAVMALARLAATFHTPDGRVAVDGFYDRVRDLTPEEREEIAAIPFDEEQYRRSVGAVDLWGEPGYSVLERNWARPTLDLNGIWGGFQGSGTKTVTPCEAHLKISARLVADQGPEEILDLIACHVACYCPPGAEVNFVPFPGAAHPFMIRRDHPALQTAGVVLHDLYEKEPLVVRMGGTLPVAEIFQRELDADMIFFTWSMPGCNMHAPNEWFRLEDFRIARRAFCAYLNALVT